MKRSQLIFTFTCLLWAFSIGLGLYLLMKHELSPGKPAKPPVNWPKDSNLKLSTDKDTLVMFVHPQCPCTRASLEQLTPLTKMENLAIQILIFSPKIKPKDWSEKTCSDLNLSQKSVSMVPDYDGLEARRFQSKTSGQALLYDSKGRLIFTGGITGARGKTGNNPGLIELCSAIREHNNSGKVRETLVFGCSLLNTDSPNK